VLCDVCAELEKILEPLRATCLAKVKANSVKQEYEKQDELKRSALRAVNALLEIPDVGTLALFSRCYTITLLLANCNIMRCLSNS
jgi:hypothetical protein